MACGAEDRCTVRYGKGTIWSASSALEEGGLVPYPTAQQVVTWTSRLGMPIVLYIQRRGSRERQ